MSDRRKLGPIRQLSLQHDIQTRPILKKQLSIEHLENIEEHKIKYDHPRMIKVAWAENRQINKDDIPHQSPAHFNEPVEVKKCKEFKRPTTAKLKPQISFEKESILYTREELAERLRKAWKEQQENKQNLDIFLTPNLQEKQIEIETDNDTYYNNYDNRNNNNNETEDILTNFNNKQFLNNNNNNNNKKVIKQKVEPENMYIPSTTNSKPQDVRTNISVKIPNVNTFNKHNIIIESSLPNKSESSIKISEETPQEKRPNKLIKQTSLIQQQQQQQPEEERIPEKNQPQRPMTASSAAAASKRESFQKRTNTAFTGSITTEKPVRPPLIRALSVPVKTEGNKLKFIATKRRLKSARRRVKDLDETEENGEKPTVKKNVRCKSAPNADVVTMVSLVSPAGSDAEETPDNNKKQEVKNKITPPVKNVSNNAEQMQTITLRKTVKSVSFQQSSIHSVRSFSASFPSRRGLLIPSHSVTSAFPEREKRAPLETSPGESRGPKRRLVKSFSVAGDQKIMENKERPNNNSSKYEINDFNDIVSCNQTSKESPPKSSQKTPESEESNKIIKADIHHITNSEDVSSDEETQEDIIEETEENLQNAKEEIDPNLPKFETNKEKECWIMFKKMSDKGLPVSYDTILRGMLTPTEYRKSRKDIIT